MRTLKWLALTFVALGLMLGLTSTSAAAPNRLVLAFYYPWYDHNTWNDPVVPDHPPDRYTSSDAGVIARQIAQARRANIDAFVSAWYGPQAQINQTEANLRTLLSLAQQQGFSIAVGFETTGSFFHSSDDVKSALSYLLREHATKPAYLRWNGKPVVFFWAQGSLPRANGQSLVEVWQNIRNQVDPNHNSLWIAEGFDMALLGVFDGDYLYNVAWSDDVGPTQRQWAARVRAKNALWVGTVMPGWDDTRLGERPRRFKRERENGTWYQRTWAGAASANPNWIVITSWNEFVENTYIEPSANFGALYLDLTRALAAQWKASPTVEIAPQSAPATSTPAPTRTPTAKPAQTPPPTRMPTSVIAPIDVECTITFMNFCLLR